MTIGLPHSLWVNVSNKLENGQLMGRIAVIGPKSILSSWTWNRICWVRLRDLRSRYYPDTTPYCPSPAARYLLAIFFGPGLALPQKAALQCTEFLTVSSWMMWLLELRYWRSPLRSCRWLHIDAF